MACLNGLCEVGVECGQVCMGIGTLTVEHKERERMREGRKGKGGDELENSVKMGGGGDDCR